MGRTDYSQHVPAADRALHLLEVIASSREGMTGTALLEEVGGSRSGLYALLNTLRSRGYVLPDDGRYVPGPALRSLAPVRPVSLDHLVDTFRSITSDEALDESVALSWPDGTGTVIAAETRGLRGVLAVYETGTRRPAGSPDAEVLAAGDGTNPGGLESVRSEGISVKSDDEMTEIAAPVCHDGVHPVAAVLVGVPAQRAEERRIFEMVQQLRQMAARLSYRIGASVYKPYDWVAREPVGPSIDLGDEELDEFLRGLWSAQLACVKADGTPHVVPLWYEWDGAHMWLAASPGASWRSHVTENAQVSVTLDEPWPPLRRVFVSGRAVEVSSEEVPGGLAGLRRRLGTRYLGRGAEGRPELVDTEGWSAFRIDPDRIRGRQGLGSTSLEVAS